jgi:3-oxoacyl-[acyl-carrier protein] reductase
MTTAAAPGQRALAVAADVTDPAALAALRERVTAELGPADVLAAFAGGEGRPVPLEQLDAQQWRRTLEANLVSVFLSIQAFLPDLLERRGAVLTMSSAAGRQPSQANLAYGAANAGLVMLTRQLATELGPRGVRVNALAPSSVRTEKVARQMPPQVQEQVADLHPLRRLGTMEDVAQAALFLASDAAAYLTGLTVDVSGGRVTN